MSSQYEQPRIDRSSPVPLYHQLRGVLEYLIYSGDYKPGEPVSGENELCELYGVSRTTVRQTIREMIKDGVLYRKGSRGRPLVAPIVIHQHLLRLRGFFTEDMLTAGLIPHTTVVSVEMRTFPDVSKKLNLNSNAPIYRIERIHHGNGEPLALQVSYIPEEVCPDLHKKDLSASLVYYFESQYVGPIVKAKQLIRVQHATNEERDRMHLPHRLPLFKVERVMLADGDRPVEYFECLLRSDRYQLEMELGWGSDDQNHVDILSGLSELK